MNDFLYIEEIKNVFSTSLMLIIEELGIYTLVQCKIDTGCSYTNIPIQRLNVSGEQARKLKQKAIKESRSFHLTYGVSDSEENKEQEKLLIRNHKLMEVSSLRFQYTANNFVLGNQELSIRDVGVNFDRTNNILIGLDILKQFQIVMDTSIITGRYTLIGCLKEKRDKMEYYNAIHRHFGMFDDFDKIYRK